jgi:hypothetical protein
MDHYIAYHSVELMGRQYKPTEQFHFFSRKPQSVLRRALGTESGLLSVGVMGPPPPSRSRGRSRLPRFAPNQTALA